MGFYTEITISNDRWHDIAKDPQAFVDAIMVGMNEGVGDPLHQALEEDRDAEHYMHSHTHYVRSMTPGGVLVHRAQHADTAQVIVSTYGSQAIAAHEIPYAIQMGWLNGGAYREDHALKVAMELEDLAKNIREAIRKDVRKKA